MRTMTLLEVSDLQVDYGAVRALRGVSLAISPGQVVALLGNNGAGKSSLLNTLAGLQLPSHGRIIFGGQSIVGWSAERVNRAGIALVPEGRQLFTDLSVLQNLRLGAFGRRVSDTDLARSFEWFPQLAERRAQRAGLLSGGEQQMVAIARALIGSPRLLMMDEPSLGLAPRLTHELFQRVRRIAADSDTAILVAEPNAALALKTADEVYVLADGAIATHGLANDLARHSEVVRLTFLGVTPEPSVPSSILQPLPRGAT